MKGTNYEIRVMAVTSPVTTQQPVEISYFPGTMAAGSSLVRKYRHPEDSMQ